MQEANIKKYQGYIQEEANIKKHQEISRDIKVISRRRQINIKKHQGYMQEEANVKKYQEMKLAKKKPSKVVLIQGTASDMMGFLIGMVSLEFSIDIHCT